MAIAYYAKITTRVLYHKASPHVNAIG